MFDIGFAELLLVSVVGLLVLGPERLPGAIRTISLWLGKLRRSFNSVRAEVVHNGDQNETRRYSACRIVSAALCGKPRRGPNHARLGSRRRMQGRDKR